MKALLISDVECRALWDYYQPDRVSGIDLIISCGDLKREYLEFLVTMTNKPVLFIPGNHDTGYVTNPPEGCENIDDTVFVFRGVRFIGFGGCKKYHEGPYQYTERDMEKRIRRARRQIRRAKGVDVVITHAAPTGCGDRKDPAHLGFDCFRDLMDRYKPGYLIHGHVHMNYDSDISRTMQYGETTVVNAYERYVLDLPDRE